VGGLPVAPDDEVAPLHQALPQQPAPNTDGWGAIVVSAVDGSGPVTLTGNVDFYWPVWRK
jgi:hypothetical protein